MDKVTFDACSISAKEKFKGFSQEEADALLAHYNEIIAKSDITGVDKKMAIRDFLKEQTLELKQEKLKQLKTLEKWANVVEPKLNESKDIFGSIEELLGSKFASTKAKTAPAYAIKHRYEEELVSAFGRIETKYPHLLKKMAKNDLELKVGIAKYIDGVKEHGLDDAGVELAQTILKYNDRIYQYKVDQGFNVNYVKGYMGKGKHLSGEEMVKFGKENFISTAKKYFDLKGSDVEVEKYLDEFYHRRVNDPNKSFWEMNDSLTQLTRIGPTKKFEQGASIKFKSNEAKVRYEHETGQHYFANLLNDYSQASGELAAAEVFGVNSGATFEKSLGKMEDQYADMGKSKSEYRRDARVLRDQFEYMVKGRLTPGPENMAAKGVSYINKWVDLTKLGPTSALSVMSDWPMAPGVFDAVTGEGFSKSVKEIFPEYVKNMFSKDAGAEMANELGFLAHTQLIETIQREGEEAIGKGGWFDKLHHFGMKFNLLHRNDVAMKRAGAFNLSRNLANNLSNSWDNLYPKLKSTLSAHGFDAEKFTYLEKGIIEKEGKKFISLEQIRDTDINEFPGTSKIEKRKFRNDLVNSLYGYVDGVTSAQVANKGLKLSAYLDQFDPNTPQGMATNLLFKFKAYPLSVMRSYKYLLETGGGKYGNIKGVAQTATSAIILSAIANVARTYALTGDMDKATTIDLDKSMNILARAGVGGIYADLLLEDRPLTESLAGPGIGMISDALRLGHQGLNAYQGKQVYNKRGFRSSMDKETMSFLKNNTPAAPYLRLAPVKAVYENMNELWRDL